MSDTTPPPSPRFVTPPADVAEPTLDDIRTLGARINADFALAEAAATIAAEHGDDTDDAFWEHLTYETDTQPPAP
jgi:hypothetical protein